MESYNPTHNSSSSYKLIDDEHIDEEEALNVGNLIIDLENVLDREKHENEQQANNINNNNANSQQSCTRTMSNNSTGGASGKLKNSDSSCADTPTKSSSSSSSTAAAANTTTANNKNSSISKYHQKSSNADRHSNNNSTTTNNNNHNNAVNNKDIDSKSPYKSGGEIKMRITKTGRSEHKIVSSPNQKSPINGANSANNNINHNNNHHHHQHHHHHHHHQQQHRSNCDETTTNSSESQQPSSSISSTKECGTSTSIGTITEPECLGPCEPGTSVTLEGIVWQETEGGILVVNVTWRGKTYVGALLDCTKHDWAPPRLCDSPASDIDSKTHKGVRTKRIVTRSNGTGVDERNLLQTTGKLRNGKGRRILNTNDPASCNKRSRESDKSIENIAAQAAEARSSPANVLSITNSDTASVPMSIDTAPTSNNELIPTTDGSVSKTGPSSPMLISCSGSNCFKKFRNNDGLSYHLSRAHDNKNDNSANAKDKIESPSDSTDSMDQEEKRHRGDVSENQETRFEGEQQVNYNSKPQTNSEQSHQEKQHTRRGTPEGASRGSSHETKSVIVQPMEPSPSIRYNNNNIESEKRSVTSSSHDHMNNSHVHMRSPSIMDNSNVSKKHHNGPPSSSNSNSQPAPPVEEGMKPSGTSTGPPPAPHQANCFFNPPFMPGSQFNPFALNPYFPGQPPPIMPSMFGAQPSTSNSLFKQLMNNIRVPPVPESPSRLLSPSVPKNLPFPPFKVDQGGPPPHMSVPTSATLTNPPMPPMPPMMNSHLPGGSPHSRMPGPNDPLLPHNLQPPPPLPFGPPMMGGPGPGNPLNRPVMPNLEDPLSKQFPRRF